MSFSVSETLTPFENHEIYDPNILPIDFSTAYHSQPQSNVHFMIGFENQELFQIDSRYKLSTQSTSDKAFLQKRPIFMLANETGDDASPRDDLRVNLRESHKLAERHRRRQMKDLFDTLQKVLPRHPMSKSSKWEILVQAINHILTLNSKIQRMEEDIINLQAQLE